MKIATTIFALLVFCSCFYTGKDQYDEAVSRLPSSWSVSDCLTIIRGATRSNIPDLRSPNIKVVATAYTPTVITAMKRRTILLGPSGQLSRFSDIPSSELHDTSSTFVNGQQDAVVRYTLLDTLTFLLAIHNEGWPGYSPDIAHLENQLLLENDRHEILKPYLLSGRQRNTLTKTEENLVIRFQLTKDFYNFLQGSEQMNLHITGFDEKIILEFPASIVK